MAFWMKPLTIIGLFCSQLSDLLLNCISFIVELLLVKYNFFVMYFLFVFGEMLPPLLTEANRWNCGLTETWSLCCFSPTSQHNAWPVVSVPLASLEHASHQKMSLVLIQIRAASEEMHVRKLFFPLLWRYSDRESSKLRRHIRKNRNTFSLCSNDKGWLNKIKYFRWDYYIKNLGLPVKY